MSYILRTFLAVIAILFGYWAEDFSSFLNLQGAFVGSFISYILPCSFFLVSAAEKDVDLGWRKTLCYAIMGFGCIGGTISTFYAIDLITLNTNIHTF